MKYFVYILRSLKGQKLYIGVSYDPDIRLLEHNSGKNKSTKHRRPFELIYKEEYSDKRSAYKREWYFKHNSEGNKLMRKLISNQ